MAMLDRDQAAIAALILNGPEHLPAHLFAGGEQAVLRGLRVHANTISHARLVALEDTYPRTRTLIGEAAFNRVSRAFIDGGGAQGRSLSTIGADFPGWLDAPAADVARVEWAWLQSYHAADAPALTLADLAGFDEAALLDLSVRAHPAVQIVVLVSDAAPLIDPAFPAGTPALLATRPEAEVRLFPVGAAEAQIWGEMKESVALGNLIARLAELHSDGGAAIAALIAAGALEKA